MESSSWRFLDSYTSSFGHLSSKSKRPRGSWISERQGNDLVYASCGSLEKASDRASDSRRPQTTIIVLVSDQLELTS